MNYIQCKEHFAIFPIANCLHPSIAPTWTKPWATTITLLCTKKLKIVSWIKHMQWSKAFSLVAIVCILKPLRIWTQPISKNNHSELHKRRKSYMDSTLIKLERPLSSTTIVWMHSWAYKNFKPWVTTTITLNCTREENHCIMGLNICCKEHFLQLPFVCSLDMLKFEINQMSNNNTLTMTLHKRRIFWAAFLSCLNLDSNPWETKRISMNCTREENCCMEWNTHHKELLSSFAIVCHCLHFLFAHLKKILHAFLSWLNPDLTHEPQQQSLWIAQEKKTVAWFKTLTIKSTFVICHCLHCLPLSAFFWCILLLLLPFPHAKIFSWVVGWTSMASWLPLSTQAIQSWLLQIYFLRCLSPFALWQADYEMSLPFLLLLEPWLKILKGDEEPPLGIYIWSSNDQMKAKQFAESCRRRLKQQIAVVSCRRTLQNQECERNPIALLCWPSSLLLLSPEEAAASPEESVSLCKPLRRVWRQLVEGSVKTTEEEWMNAKKKITTAKEE